MFIWEIFKFEWGLFGGGFGLFWGLGKMCFLIVDEGDISWYFENVWVFSWVGIIVFIGVENLGSWMGWVIKGVIGWGLNCC